MPKSKRVKAKFQYFQACCLTGGEGEEELFDLFEWIDIFSRKPIGKRALEVNGVKGRLERTLPISHYGFYALSFMRMDELSDTYTMKEDSQAKHVDLEEDEYIGKRTTALYDPATHILMVQCNRGGFGASHIESFVNQSGVCGDMCYLRPIMNQRTLEMMLERGIGKVDIRFANVRTCIPDQSKDFEGIVEAFSRLESITAHVELGLGYSGEKELNKETVSGFLHDVIANKDSISRAKVALSNDKKSDMIDLFENAEHDWIDFVLHARGEIALEEAANNMAEKYMLARRRF